MSAKFSLKVSLEEDGFITHEYQIAMKTNPDKTSYVEDIGFAMGAAISALCPAMMPTVDNIMAAIPDMLVFNRRDIPRAWEALAQAQKDANYEWRDGQTFDDVCAVVIRRDAIDEENLNKRGYKYYRVVDSLPKEEGENHEDRP